MMKAVKINVSSKMERSIAQVKKEMSNLFRVEFLDILE
jgi:hypothetical protein